MRLRDALQTGFLLLLAVAAVGTLVVQANRMRGPNQNASNVADSPTRVAEWLELRYAGPRTGPATAPLQIVYFSDFECPACKTMHRRLDSLSQRYAGNVAVTMLHFPIESLHPHARAAAVAAECAATQSRFAEYSQVLFGAQERIGITPWEDFAREAGVPDLPAFQICLRGPEVHARVRRHESMGARLGITGTPTVVVNGLMFSYPPSTAQLDSIAATVLPRAKELSAATGSQFPRSSPTEER
jgi:protein-disulfide isomerase